MSVRPNSAAFSSVNSSIFAITVSSRADFRSRNYRLSAIPRSRHGRQEQEGETLQRRPYLSDRGAHERLRRSRNRIGGLRVGGGDTLRPVSEMTSLGARFP